MLKARADAAQDQNAQLPADLEAAKRRQQQERPNAAVPAEAAEVNPLVKRC